MAKTQDIKRRIRSIRNTMQLTRAMKMVAASKLRRAQERIMRSRPYAKQTLKILQSLSARANPESNALLEVHGDHNIEMVVITADKGLCGGFNTNILRTAETAAKERHGRNITWNTVGRKGREYFRHRRWIPQRELVDVFRTLDFKTAQQIARDLMELYLEQELDEIYLVYNEFKSAIQATPIVQRLLPIEPMEIAGDTTPEDYIYEPDQETLFQKLLPHYVEITVFQALLESAAAEHAARMTAMDSATNNAGELIETLTLNMNRVRQAAITTEIIEVVSGAEALG